MGRKRIVALLVSLLMIFMTPLTAGASIKDYTNGIDMENTHYYPIMYDDDFENKQLFLKSVLQTNNLDDYWNAAAYMTFVDKLQSLEFSTRQSDYHCNLQKRHMCGKNYNDGEYINTTWTDTDLNYAESLYSAYDQIEASIYENYKKSETGQIRSRDDVINKDLKDQASKEIEPILWRTTGYTVRPCDSTQNWDGHYIQLSVIYHNFRMTPIIPEDYGRGTTDYEDTPDSMIDTINGYTNSSKEPVQATQRLAKTRTETVQNEINGTDTYSFSQNASISTSVSVGTLFGDVSVEASFGIGAEQAFSSGWSDTVSKSEEFNSESEATVNMPAHTQLQLGQNAGKQVFTNTYDCPVAISYDVIIAAHTWDPSKEKGSIRSLVLTTFDNSIGAAQDAREDYIRRVMKGYYDKDQIAWGKASWEMGCIWMRPELADTPGFFELGNNLKRGLYGVAPMSVAGGKMTYSIDRTYTTIQDLTALYSLNNVRLDQGEAEYNMRIGDALVVDNIGLTGYNDKGIAYYGFQPRLGSWILVDENKNPIADSEVGYLDTNGVTGTTRLVASDVGTLYLKYIIPEDIYNAAENLENYATNDTIDTSYIQINISNAPFYGTVEASGSVEGYAEEDINLDTAEGLSYRILDENEVEVGNAPVEWVLQEANGASITNNVFTASEAGTYHIRALYQNQWSDEWLPVTISPARELVSVELLDDQFETPYLSDKEFLNQNMLDLSMLTCKGYDQYGDPWNIQNLVYEIKSDPEHVWVNPDSGLVNIDAPGTYEFAVLADGVESNTMSVTVYQTYQLNWQDTGHGTIMVTDGGEIQYLDGNRVREDSVIYVTAVPEDGYECKGLYINGEEVASDSSYIVDKNTTIQADFDKIVLTGWQDEDGGRYYYDDNGNRVTGWQNISGQRYYFNESGRMQLGWKWMENNWYYFGTDAQDGAMRIGWQKIKNKWYYLSDSLSDGSMKIGWQKVKNKWYYLSNSKSDGSMKIGWQKIKNKRYYLSGSQNDGSMKIGWQKINGKWYYLSNSQSDGSMKIGWQKIYGKWYYLSDSQDDGAMKIGWQYIEGYWYYLGSSQNDGARKVGWQKIDGRWHYFTKIDAPVGHKIR